LVIAVRTWTLLIFMLLSGVGSFLAGWIVADTHYGETGLWVGLAVGVVVAVGTILGVRRSVHAPQKRKGGILAIVGAVGLGTPKNQAIPRGVYFPHAARAEGTSFGAS